jgi:hypothetical protein
MLVRRAALQQWEKPWNFNGLPDSDGFLPAYLANVEA